MPTFGAIVRRVQGHARRGVLGTQSEVGGRLESRVPSRRFPPPWTVEEQAACFTVRDPNGLELLCHSCVNARENYNEAH